ncbi:BTAD domain-containing putative transcriptional regulator [Paragemmobacter straminiformis]|uniref:Transcriptional regulator n=1 Tax=Paragemmobacter straminiformis TaxID=2045119 RepID=A0A842IBN7_9RHOB|nr:BTAD domain-containing putative transcriptional regulator [Gemmobacter straminiformis]MBC2836514.1 transcriptional regulator [Gemmobacter straminiformis]
MGEWALLDAHGQPLPRLGRKAFALLVYLSLANGGRATRDRLADLLWPDRDTGQARSSLRQTLSVIRATLGDLGLQLFDCDREFIALTPGLLASDAREVLGHTATATDPARVDALYGGPFLDGFFSGSQVFEDWAAALREKIDAQVVQALHALVRGLPPDRGLQLFPRLLAIDPLRESSYQLGMELHAALRQRDRALRVYESCKVMLAQEYGVTPSPETERIRRRVLDGLPVEPQGATPSPVGAGNGAGQGAGQGKPVVRVMRFANLSADPGQDRFLHGLHDAIVIELCHMREVTAVRMPESGAPLPYADYILTGSLIEQGGKVEVIVRLVNAETGQDISGERFRGTTGALLDLLRDVSQSVALSTRFEVLQAGWNLQDLLPVDDHPVRLRVLRAHSRYYELTASSLQDAIRLCEEALEIAPSSLRAQRMLSLAISGSLVQGVIGRTAENVMRAVELARRVARAAPEDVFTRCVLAWALGNAGKHEAAVEELRYAIRLNPLYPTLHSDLAEHYALLGYASEAIAECAEAIRLTADDVVSFWRYHSIAVAQFAAGNYAEALENARRVMREKPGLLRGALVRAAAAAALGLKDEAAQTVADILRERPDLRLATVSPAFMPRYVQDPHHSVFLDMLAKAGLPA